VRAALLSQDVAMRVWLSLVLICMGSLASAAPIHNQRLNFSFSVPERLRLLSPEGMNKATLYALGADGSFELIAVQDLGVTIAKAPLDKHAIETSEQQGGLQDARFDYRKAKWRGLELDMVLTSWKVNEGRLVKVAVQVPLASHAIQLLATGHAKDEAQIVADVLALLGTIEGESSWTGARR
jgi:hypothetical protein